ncbi:MAG: caspase family protein, partial [Planctomycetaceae bacterium]|nr:caspase family protein [Planctomycetaceae bacterium]
MKYDCSQLIQLTVLKKSLLTLILITFVPVTDADAGISRAFLIGVSEYESPAAPDLPLVKNDLNHLYTTLTTYGQFEKKHVVRALDGGVINAESKALKKVFPQWLSQAQTEDAILVYFSGHGFQDASGNLYLATADFDIRNPEETGLPVSWLRNQLASCKAGFKLLILDSCHAGSEKNAEMDNRVSAKELGTPFEDLKNVVTIASSQADEKSLFYFNQKRSLFSFWMTEGMKGHADFNQDGMIDIDELYKYVSRRVRHSANALYSKSQTPVRIVRTGVIDVPTVLKLHPQPLKQTLSNMAEHISIVMQENKLEQLGVLEFLDNTNTLQEKLGGDFGLLGKFCSEEIERQLAELKLSGGFGLVNRKRLRSALKEQGFKIDDLSSNLKLAGLSKSVGNMPVVVLGTFQSRKGRVVRLRCNMQQTTGFEDLDTIGGSAELSLDEWAMLGHSAAVRAEDRQVNPFNQQKEDISIQTQVVNRLDARSQGGHILLDPAFPFDVQLVINDKVRQGVVRGNDYFVPVKQGEVYSIRIVNKQG